MEGYSTDRSSCYEILLVVRNSRSRGSVSGLTEAASRFGARVDPEIAACERASDVAGGARQCYSQ